MKIYNKTTILPSIDALFALLNQEQSVESDCFFCIGDRIAIEHKQNKTNHSIRIWKARSIFSWIEGFFAKQSIFIGAIDYTIHPDHIKIDYLGVNDDEYIIKNKDFTLDNETAKELTSSMLNFIVDVAISNGLKKIIIDVHENYRIYCKYYIQKGFVLTGRKCEDNACCIEIEKHIIKQ